MIKSSSFDLLVILILVFLVFLSGIFVSAGLSSLAGALIVIFILSKSSKIYKSEVSLVLPLILIFLIGLTGAVLNRHPDSKENLFLTGKDIWYYLKPAIYFISGLYVFRMKIRKEVILSLLIYSSFIIAIQHLVRVIIFFSSVDPGLLVLDTIRSRTSFVNIIESLSLAFILIHYEKSEVKNLIIIPRWLLIAVLTASLIFSLSRTLIVSFIITLLAFNDFFTFRVNAFIRSALKMLIICLFFFLVMFFVNAGSQNGSIVHSLSGKFLNSLKETSYLRNYANNAILNRNWRGYETHLTEEEIKKGNIIERLLGYGFGKTVFIGYGGFLGENINIPKFHNGFVEILLKTGYIGLLLYIIFFFYVFRLADFAHTGDETESLFKAVIIITFFSTFVITGLYNKTALDSSCFLMGYFSGTCFKVLAERKFDSFH